MTLMAMVLVILYLVVGMAFAAWLDARFVRTATGTAQPSAVSQAARLLRQQTATTEAPDALNWALAPALYLFLAVLGLAIVPIAEGVVAIPSSVGIVVWGTCESLTVIAVFLHGWSSNSPLPLIGGYRYVAIGLPAMLVSMFVLIAVALPAESLGMTAVVESQADTWNVLRHPLGLPLFLILGLSLTLRGPLDYADAADLAGGTSVEDSGERRFAWQIARLAMLVSFSGVASAAFLGGPLGPWLPGPVWLALKMACLITIVVLLGHLVARTTPSRFMERLWTLWLPLAFLDLAVAGGLALW